MTTIIFWSFTGYARKPSTKFELFILYDVPIACHLYAPLSLDSCVKSISVIGHEEKVGSAKHLVHDFPPSHWKRNFLPNRCPPRGAKSSFTSPPAISILRLVARDLIRSPRRPRSHSFASSPAISFVRLVARDLTRSPRRPRSHSFASSPAISLVRLVVRGLIRSPRRPRSHSFASSPAISFVLSISQALSISPLALLIFEDLIVADARQDRTPTGQFVIGCTEPVAVVTGIDSSLKHSQVCK